ncbi:hypothetical protein FEM03_19075 [Phragmitibacter flavus]|uniref:Peptidase C39-like domain-containing protein n=1 Tax=Phragmitibacter flavus TaxID=2576071 RepID=A0A5R8KA52_9BACT|nr:C39 family peptidase [Phragmitibacter flavus]TLD69202.1 hypothetical protein FEM03_19075 [Phragmitibacter flavus]
MISRLIRASVARTGVFVVLILMSMGGVMVASAQERMHELKLDLDAVLKLPDLWDLTPETLAERCPAEGFESNPFFKWAAEETSGNRFAFFSRQPFANVKVEASLFGGTVLVNTMVVQFTNNKVTEVLVVLHGTEVDGLLGLDEFDAKKSACATGLVGLVGAQAMGQKRYFGSKLVRSLESQSYSGKEATACLDAGVEAKLVRFVLAPAGTDPAVLLAQPVVELERGATEYFCDLDGLMKFPQSWEMTPAKFEAAFGVDRSGDTPIFQWLNAEKTAARFSRQPFSNVAVDLTMFGGRDRVEEAVFDFADGKLSQVYVSLYNRGDSGPISKDEFDARFKKSGQALIGLLGARPVEHRSTAPTAVKTTSWLWNTPHTLALLEYNAEATVKKAAAEFLRLRVAPVARRDQLLNIAAIGQSTTTLKRGDLLQFVKKESNGDVLVTGIPMVDQGAKGYCVVASCERLFGYLNIPCDQHELASIAGSEADRGTTGAAFVEALKKINTRFKVRFKALLEKAPLERSDAREARPDRFAKMIQEQIDRGVPLLWALQLGLFPEEPNTALQAGGGHMRLIIGYNIPREEVLFSDSWGAGHELKRMKLTDAVNATFGVYLVEPKGR